MNEILFLQPHFTHNIWGGEKLRTEFLYDIEGSDIGECWGIAAHENGDAMIKGKNISLRTFYGSHPEYFGNTGLTKFPLLTKIIDAREDLSIQVHPDDDYAKQNENGSLGKTECWYILDADEQSTLVVGHNATSHEELEKMVAEERWKELIREVPVKKGDFIQIDPGTVHAIKGGILLLETQQNSDITYRLYDYDRLQDGKKRPLHIEKSLDVIPAPAPKIDAQIIRREEIEKKQKVNELFTLYDSEKYKVFLLHVDGETNVEQKYHFLNLSVTEGEGSIDGQKIKKGDHLIVPFEYGTFKLTGKMKLVGSTV